MSKRSKLSSNSLSLDFTVFSQPEVKEENESLEKKTKLEPRTKSENMLLCIDFDETMVKGSLHNAFRHKWDLNKFNDCVDEFLADEEKGWKNKKQLKTLLKKASDLGCHIAIVSFGSYPDAIKYALTKLGLKQAISEKIHVESYLPNENEIPIIRKQNHIKKAMKHFNVYDDKKVVLIDDDLNNVDKALKDGMHAIHVAEDNTEYLDQAFKILNKERLNEEVQTQKATNQLSEYTDSQDSLDQSTSSTDSGLGLSGQLSPDSDVSDVML